MPQTQLKGKKSEVVGEVEIFMRGPCTVRPGATMYFPSSIEVSAGEPSEYKRFHDKYAGQRCKVTRITVADVTHVPGLSPPKNEARFDIEFNDGHIRKSMDPDSLIFVERAPGVYVE